MSDDLTRRRHNATGRSVGAFGNSKFRKANAPPKGEPWIWMTKEMIQSFAFRALSSSGQKVVFRIVAEHLAHGGSQNGDLPVTHANFEEYGISPESILLGLAEATTVGLVQRTDPGRRAFGEDKGRPARFRVCWLPNHDGEPASERWKRFTSLQQAKKAVAEARKAIVAKREEQRKAREDGANVIPRRRKAA